MCLEQFLWVFENPTGTNSQIAGFNRNRSISIEETSKGWMFFIVSDTKFFHETWMSVNQNSVITHPYKREIADMLSGKNIFSTMDPSYNEL